jgi:PAS domain S-box-containing protein
MLIPTNTSRRFTGMFSVLYVDDASDLLELGKLYLEATGDFSITTADSADKGLELLEESSFDLILSDFDMPCMNGIGFLTEVRARYRDIPFILFTGRERDEIVVEAISHGADFYLQKGSDTKAQFAELAHKIRQAVRRQQAEKALAMSRDYLDKIFSSVKAGILVIYAATNTIIDINPAAAEMIGTPRDQILGRSCHRYVCPAETGRCPISDLGQQVDNSEKILLAAGGIQVPIIKYVTRVELFGKTCLLETFIDNTERKRAENELKAAYEEMKRNQEEIHAAYAELAANEQVLLSDYGKLMQSEQQLREKEVQLRSLFDSANDAIFLFSDGVFIRCNKKTLEIFGCSDESQVIGHSPTDFSPEFQPDGSHSADRIREYNKHVLAGSGIAFEWVHSRRDGTPFHADVSLNPVEIGGKTCILSIVRDISDRRQADTAMRLARKKLHMMNNVTRHEIRATLAGLLKSAEEAGTGAAGDRRQTLLRTIRTDLHRLQRQIQFTEEYEEIGIHPPCWLTIRQLIPAMVDLEITIDPELETYELFADPLIVRVFRYIAENTVRHGIRATAMHFRTEQTGNALRITAEDNGIGIPEDRKKKIFEWKAGDRTGMGLFLVREILAITGISITETGTPGKGARFEILVPERVYRKKGT